MNYIQSLSILALLVVIFSSKWIAADQIACPAGWVSANGKFPGCQACPLGTYQNRLSRKACKECPSNTTTNETGVVSKDQCHTVNTGSDEGQQPCERGSYSTTGHTPCTPCSIGYYSISTTTCKKCPSKRTTVSVGATHRRNCIKAKLLVSCPQGSTSPSGYQPCSKCPIGYYQPYKGQRVCAKCPEGLSNEVEGAMNCTNITEAEQQDDKTATCKEVKYQRVKGVKLKRINEEKGFFSSANYPHDYNLGTKQQWRVHCFDDEYVGIIIAHMSLSEGDYLQVKDDRCSGNMTRPTSRIIRKNSASVIFSGENGNSKGFQCAFLCIADYKRAWAESVLYNDEIMEIIKPVNDTVGIEKAIDLILKYPFSWLSGFNDPYQRQILQIIFGDIQ